ncbi:morphogenetic protein [Enterobacter kobei]|uniref:morphogenetic protein n=1 Tax=Enterobacter kobei TaxID=208224 RepID=UPI0020068C89|nr:morphogenetic protein [Enterobacter kobei]MCK6822441.1 morphogenetic protein [Enterobacter kobei]
MKERGMIFNGEMVRAILDGRKTQTRRIIKPQPVMYEPGQSIHVSDMINDALRCPFGQVGNRIWVREAFQGPLVSEELLEEYRAYPEKFENPEYCEYAADGGPRPEYCDLDDNLRHGWRPSIHMPRWASRLILEITGVRVERLQAITLGDICKEIGCGLYDFRPATYGFQVWEDLWKSIYGEENWQANPWVWVIEFKVVPNVQDNPA